MPDHRLAGQVAIVTGGARGIGASCVRRLSAQGAEVICADILEPADFLDPQITVEAKGPAIAASRGKQAASFHLDVTSAADWQAAIHEAESRFGFVSILVNNAGCHGKGPIETMTEEDYRRVLDVNQVGTFLGMKAVIPSMRKGGRGSIINVSSVAGMAGIAGRCAYVASKFAIRGMTKVAALELGRYGIRVNSVHPGLIATPMTADMEEPDWLPLKRMGQPADVSQMVSYLASDESSYCTGSEFVIDGGFLNVVGQHA
jgi:3alpha(or 20beta)-hydroxysteroid dehydrogenase